MGNIFIIFLIVLILIVIVKYSIKSKAYPHYPTFYNSKKKNKSKIDFTSEFLQINNKNTECPYCFHAFDKILKRKRKCPSCSRTIRVSSVQETIYVFTEEEYIDFKKAQKRENFTRKWLRELDYYDITVDDFLEGKNIFLKNNGFEARDHDILWGLFNQTVLQLQDMEDQSSLYWQMARFLYEEDKNHYKKHLLSFSLKLKNYKSQGVTLVEIFACASSCNNCLHQNNKKLTIADALKKQPLPCKDCTYELDVGNSGWCRCTYVPSIE